MLLTWKENRKKKKVKKGEKEKKKQRKKKIMNNKIRKEICLENRNKLTKKSFFCLSFKTHMYS
jgi:hypothetical protein